jgi:GR25 family glycosyltransferase involved in LPS biosynthesis
MACQYVVDNNLPWMVVLEDDALVTEKFSNIVDAITGDKNLEYDFISLWDQKPQIVDKKLSTGNAFVQRSYNQRYGTVAMIYSNEGARNILNLFKDKGFYTTYDVALYSESRALNLIGLSYINSIATIVKHVDVSRAKTEIGSLDKRKPKY